MASTSTSASFYTTFHSLKSEITQALESNDIPKATQSLINLKSQFRENVISLPAYDERSYDTQIRELENKISSLRPKSKTSKFSFTKPKSTPAVPPPNPDPNHSALSSEAHSSPSQDISHQTPTPKSGDGITFQNLKSAVIRLDPLNKSSTVILKNLEMCIIDLRPSSPSSSSASDFSTPASPPPPPPRSKGYIENENRSQITSLHGENLRYCTLIAPVDGSILFHSLSSCILIIRCHQFRMHDSTNSSIMIQIPSMPIIENSKNIGFGPLPPNDLVPPTNHLSRHGEVQDFNWVREGVSPNWRITSEEERTVQIEGIIRAISDSDKALVVSEQALETPD